MPNKLVTALLLVPFTTLAAEFPVWTVENDKACYKFEDARKLKLAEQECIRIEVENVRLRIENPLLAKEKVDLKAAVAALNVSLGSQQQVVKKLQAERGDLEQKLLECKGPGYIDWKWAVLTGAAGLLAGGIIGYKLAK